MRDVLRALRRRDELVDAARRAHDAAWDEKHARFRERCADVQATLRARHADAIDRLRERLEDDSRVSAPSEWSPQLEEMRRSQRALVKKKRFGEALDLVKRLEELEEREIKKHRERVREANKATLEEMFAAHAKERAVCLKEIAAEEELFRSVRLRATRAHEKETRRKDYVAILEKADAAAADAAAAAATSMKRSTRPRYRRSAGRMTSEDSFDEEEEEEEEDSPRFPSPGEKVLKERRSPRERGRMGTIVARTVRPFPSSRLASTRASGSPYDLVEQRGTPASASRGGGWSSPTSTSTATATATAATKRGDAEVLTLTYGGGAAAAAEAAAEAAEKESDAPRTTRPPPPRSQRGERDGEYPAGARAHPTAASMDEAETFHAGPFRLDGVYPSEQAAALASIWRVQSATLAPPPPPPTPPAEGPSGAEAQAAADSLTAAAMRMTGAAAVVVKKDENDARDAPRFAKRQSLTQKRRELETLKKLEDDDDDDIDDLDDIDLVAAATPKRLLERCANVVAIAAPGPGPGPAAAANSDAIGGGRGNVGPRLDLSRVERVSQPLGLARGVARDVVPDGVGDPGRDKPEAVKGAAILRRILGPEDGYRSVRRGAAAAGGGSNLGALGRVETGDDSHSHSNGGDDDSRSSSSFQFASVLGVDPRRTRTLEELAPSPRPPAPPVAATVERGSSRLASLHSSLASETAAAAAAIEEDVADVDGDALNARLFDETAAAAAAAAAARREPELSLRPVVNVAGLSGAYLKAAKEDSATYSRSISLGVDPPLAKDSAMRAVVDDNGRAAAVSTAQAAAALAACKYGARSTAAPATSTYGAYVDQWKPSTVESTESAGTAFADVSSSQPLVVARPSVVAASNRVPMPLGEGVDVLSGLPTSEFLKAAKLARKAAKLKLNGGIKSDPFADENDDDDDASVYGSSAHGGSPGGSSTMSSVADAAAEKKPLAPVEEKEYPAFIKAARRGEYAKVKKYFKRGIDANVVDTFGNTALIVACQNGHGRIVKMAERYGGNVNAKNNKGNTALHFTVQLGFNALGDFLVEKGADKDAKNAAGLTPYEGIG